MTKFILLFVSAVFTTSAYAGPACEKFKAFMSSRNRECPYVGVKIEYRDKVQEMLITIYGGRDYWEEWYIADGAPHPGDGDFTGKTYSVDCGESTMTIRREEIFGANLTDTYTLSNGGLDYVSHPDGASNSVRCRFEP